METPTMLIDELRRAAEKSGAMDFYLALLDSDLLTQVEKLKVCEHKSKYGYGRNEHA